MTNRHFWTLVAWLGTLWLCVATRQTLGADIVARSDRVSLAGTAPVTLDLLANDEHRLGRELVVEVNAAQIPGLTVVDNGDGTVLLARTSTAATGDVTFTYRARERGGSSTSPVRSVRVCWGTTACEIEGAFGGDEGGGDEPPPPTDLCTDLCFSLAGNRHVSGEVVALGNAPSGTVRELPLILENRLGQPIEIEAIILGDPLGLRFVENDTASAPIRRIMADGELSAVDLRHVFLPVTANAANYNSVYVQERRLDGATPRSWVLTFSSFGDGPLVVPGYESCTLGDVCLFYQSVKLGSLLAQTSLGFAELGEARPGEGRSVTLTLVRNAAPGDSPLPFQISAAAPFRALLNGQPISGGQLESRAAYPLTIQFQPTVEGVFRAPISIQVGLAGGSLGFEARASSCAELCLSYAPAATTYLADGDLQSLANDGVAQTHTTLILRSNALTRRDFSVEARDPSDSAAAGVRYSLFGSACGQGSTATRCVGSIDPGQHVSLLMTTKLGADSAAGSFDTIVALGGFIKTVQWHVSRCVDFCVYDGSRQLLSSATLDLGDVARAVASSRTLHVVNRNANADVSLDPAIATAPFSLVGASGSLRTNSVRRIELRVTPALGTNTGSMRLGLQPLWQANVRARGVTFTLIRMGTITYVVPST